LAGPWVRGAPGSAGPLHCRVRRGDSYLLSLKRPILEVSCHCCWLCVTNCERKQKVNSLTVNQRLRLFVSKIVSITMCCGCFSQSSPHHRVHLHQLLAQSRDYQTIRLPRHVGSFMSRLVASLFFTKTLRHD